MTLVALLPCEKTGLMSQFQDVQRDISLVVSRLLVILVCVVA